MSPSKLEIERKFLVKVSRLPKLEGGIPIIQGYLSRKPSVRVRLCGNEQGYLTIKGKGTVSRPEYEYSISVEDARDLLSLCSSKIQKIRYHVTVGTYTWEVDEFLGSLKGLWLAEVELPFESASFEKPTWAGKEVSEDSSYSNASLAESGKIP